jgi:RNA polymerase sigma factor (sigma-70 family)
VPTERLPDRSGADPHADVGVRNVVRTALRELPHQQRAVLMLRYHADLTEAATARTLGISLGTVKSYTARALATLRADPALRDLLHEEANQ